MQARSGFTVSDFFWLLVGFVLHMSPLTAAGLLLLTITTCGALFRLASADWLDRSAPSWGDFAFSSDYRRVTLPDGRWWNITYEKNTFSVFTGTAREVIHLRDEAGIPFATHDILLTNGEYSSPARVSAQVVNRTVRYQWYTSQTPEGTLHLLHIVPLNEDVYHQLLQVRRWNRVSIKGQEILRIESFDPTGRLRLIFQDEGCNTILVTSVQVLEPGTPVP